MIKKSNPWDLVANEKGNCSWTLRERASPWGALGREVSRGLGRDDGDVQGTAGLQGPWRRAVKSSEGAAGPAGMPRPGLVF